jgi:hypothetical protein
MTDIHWNPAHRLPTPGIPLKLKLATGDIIDGIRPSYIQSYGLKDLGYKDSSGGSVQSVEFWAIA